MSEPDDDGMTPQERLLEEAALWRERIARDPGRKAREDFDRWIAASPAHAEALADVEASLALAREAAEEPGILALRQQTLARVALARRPPSRIPRAAAAAVALLLAVPAVWFGYPRVADLLAEGASVPSQAYGTAIGERRTIRLADGSQVTLNTDSALQVAYSDGERRLTLDRGQALFKVAKDARRPFVVVSQDRQVVAHGTEFDVRIADGFFRVALLEGSVSVSPTRGRSGGRVTLQPNEVLTARGDRIAVEREDASTLASWREGLLILRDTDLRSAVTEMNRYNPTRIEIADERTARLRISGAFRVGESEAFVDALKDVLPLDTTERTAERIVLKAN